MEKEEEEEERRHKPPTERNFPHTDSLSETSHTVFMFVFTAADNGKKL